MKVLRPGKRNSGRITSNILESYIAVSLQMVTEKVKGNVSQCTQVRSCPNSHMKKMLILKGSKSS